LVQELEDLASPIGTFIRDRCQVGPGCQIERAALFDAWKLWCTEQGRDRPGDAGTFGRNLRAAIPKLGTAQQRTDGDRIRVYEGIRLK